MCACSRTDPALLRPILFKVSPLPPAIGWGSITLLCAVNLSRKAVLYVLLNVRYFSLRVPLCLRYAGLYLFILAVGLILCGSRLYLANLRV